MRSSMVQYSLQCASRCAAAMVPARVLPGGRLAMTASPAGINREEIEQICSQQMVGQSSHGSIAAVCSFKQSLCRC